MTSEPAGHQTWAAGNIKDGVFAGPQVAFDLGYQSQSVFIGMFRKELGVPPGQYARKQGSTP